MAEGARVKAQWLVLCLSFLSVEAASLRANEVRASEGRAEALVEVFGPAGWTIRYATRPWSALEGADYLAVEGTFTFTAEAPSLLVPIPLVNDGKAEETEFFLFDVFREDGTRLTRRVYIEDNDPGFWIAGASTNLQTTIVVTDETAGFVDIQVARGNDSDQVVSVEYRTEPGSATPDSDYLPVSGTLVFQPGEAWKSVRVPLIDDYRPEGAESFALVLANPSPGTILSPFARGEVQMQDADAGLRFERPVYYANEEALYAEVRILHGNSQAPVTTRLTLSLENETAVLGKDFQAIQTNVTLDSRDPFLSVRIPLLDDSLLEGVESFAVRIVSSEPVPPGDPAVARVLIRDREGPIDVEFAKDLRTLYSMVRMVRQPDGKIVLASGEALAALARIDPSGKLDPTFGTGGIVRFEAAINHGSPWGTLSLDSKGRIVIAGRFYESGLLRFLPNGARDTNFIPPSSALRFLMNATVLADDSIVATRFGGLTNYLVKIKESGEFDESFQSHPASSLQRAHLASDALGRIYVGDARLLSDGTNRVWPLFRLLPKGAPDPSFQRLPGTPSITGMKLDANGKILVSLYAPECVPGPERELCSSLFRLNDDGTIDASFRSDLHQANALKLLSIEPSGKILVSRANELGPGLQRLMPDGSRDATLWTGFEHVAATEALGLDDGSVLALDYYWAVRDGERYYPMVLVRPAPLAIERAQRMGALLEIAAVVKSEGDYALEVSDDFRNWRRLATQSASPGRIVFTAPLEQKAGYFRVAALSGISTEAGAAYR